MKSILKAACIAVLGSAVLAGCQVAPEKPSSVATLPPEKTSPRKSTRTITAADPVRRTSNTTTTETEAQPASDLWQLTRDHFALNLTQDNSRIDAQVRWYSRHPHYLSRVMDRASRYYHYILHETLKRGMPAELALLPVVESAYDPFAYSHGRAAGPWQFIPSTGKHFGLKQSWWYDGRRDIAASTDAALTYLQRLYDRFGDWELALAAYNAGGGTVSLAMKRNRRAGKPTDYWSLNLPTETQAYVPKLLAISRLVASPEQYGINLTPIDNEPYFELVKTGSQIDLAQAADLAGISTKELYLLNPGFNRWATDPKGPHHLLVPVANAEQLRTNLASLPAEQRVKWSRHTIKSGESLISIAQDYRTTVEVIRTANSLKGNNIRAGKTLLIPTASQNASEYALSQAQRLNRKQEQIAKRTNRVRQHYKVTSGDSFWSIARQHKVGVRQLASWNNMAPGDPLPVGKDLIVWKERQSASTTSGREVIRKVGYKVRSGDSLARIASRFNVSVSNILNWNKLDVSNYLKPGQRLTLYVDVTRSN